MSQPTEKRWRVESRRDRAKDTVLFYQKCEKSGVLTGDNLQSTNQGIKTATLDPETVTPEQVDEIWGCNFTETRCQLCLKVSDLTAKIPDDYDIHICEECLWEMFTAVRSARAAPVKTAIREACIKIARDAGFTDAEYQEGKP